jgi:hypothetical protein
MLLQHEGNLGIEVVQTGREKIRGRKQYLRQVLNETKGVALVASENGHCVGVSCRDALAVDTDDDVPFPVDC